MVVTNVSAPPAAGWPGLIEAYRPFLSVVPGTRVITLLEGNTPLIEAPQLARAIAGPNDLRIFLKYEGLNPTGSFKDRGMTVAMTQAVARGAEAVICASTGNTSASAAAYASRAGVKCIVLLPHGVIALGKLSQALIHGATVIPISGNFDDALRLVREISEARPVALVNSVNPDRIEGQKTGAFEICDVLGDAPYFHCIPVGNAGNITAYWKGYEEFYAAGRSTRLPHMIGFQAAGAAPIYYDRVIENPETAASAIRIGNPASWKGAANAIASSGGCIDIVTDEEILDAQAWLAKNEGIFVEPASAASVAGLLKCLTNPAPNCPLASVPVGASIVCTVTGHGLKDSDTAMRGRDYAPIEAEPDIDSVRKALGH